MSILTLAPHCPHCRRAWVKSPEAPLSPEEGDMTICDGCGGVLRFGRCGELKALSPNDERRLRRAMRELVRQR